MRQAEIKMPTSDTSLKSARALVTTLAGALRAELIETHISWVLLTADTAYKIKKPVHLPFVDYGTLQARRHFCEEEVRLNRRLAAGLYLASPATLARPSRLPSMVSAQCCSTWRAPHCRQATR